MDSSAIFQAGDAVVKTIVEMKTTSKVLKMEAMVLLRLLIQMVMVKV